jgi:hypothetical protein
MNPDYQNMHQAAELFLLHMFCSSQIPALGNDLLKRTHEKHQQQFYTGIPAHFRNF